MTTHSKEKIIAAAMQAGLAFDSEEFPEIWQTYMYVGRAEIERFWQIAFEAGRVAEREACAVVCERLISGDGICADNEVWIHDCAAAIRARGDTK